MVPIRSVIEEVLRIPSKFVEGVFRFLCPDCGGFQTGVHAKTNLSRCFRCEKNFNTIELMMSVRGVGFVESVKVLQEYLCRGGEGVKGAPGAKDKTIEACSPRV